jgi:hypothetical protein
MAVLEAGADRMEAVAAAIAVLEVITLNLFAPAPGDRSAAETQLRNCQSA